MGSETRDERASAVSVCLPSEDLNFTHSPPYTQHSKLSTMGNQSSSAGTQDQVPIAESSTESPSSSASGEGGPVIIRALVKKKKERYKGDAKKRKKVKKRHNANLAKKRGEVQNEQWGVLSPADGNGNTVAKESTQASCFKVMA